MAIVNFMQLPGYQAQNALNFQPISDAIDSNRQNALAQRRLGMEDQRLALEKQRFGLQERDSNLAYQNALASRGEFDRLMADPNSPIAKDPTIAAAARIAGYQGAPGILVQGRNADLERQRIGLQAKLTEAQLGQIKMQTPDWRLSNAQRFGIDPNTPEGRQFVISGSYAPQTTTVGHAPEGATIYQNNPKTGEVTFLTPPNARSSYDKKLDESLASKNAEDIQKGRQSQIDAEGARASAERLTGLVDQAFTGTGAGAREAAGRLLSTLGVAPDSWAKATSATEALRAGLSELVAKKAGPLKPLSNSDILFVQRMVGDTNLTPAGVKQILGTLDRISQREALFYKRYNDALMQSKNVDPGAIARSVIADIPNIDPEMQNPAGATPPRLPRGTVKDGYRYMGGDPADQNSWQKVDR